MGNKMLDCGCCLTDEGRVWCPTCAAGGARTSEHGALQEVLAERLRQDAKWGEQNHKPEWWLAILGEEYGEACQAALEAHFKGYARHGKLDDYRTELVQVAAVAVAAIESLDRARTRGVKA